MSRKARHWLMPAIAAATLVATAAAPAFADGVVDPAPIGPNQYLIGQVNDQSGPATIRMACFGPVVPGQTGHPLAGQTVRALPVVPPVSSVDGYTGSAAKSIAVAISPSSAAASAIILDDWAVPAAIPTTLTLPCGGTGVVTFAPMPTSATARAATVTVSFVGQP